MPSMIYPPTVFANIPIDRILVHQQRLVNRAAKEMDRFIDQDDWSEETLLVLTLRLASVLYDGLVYQFELDDLDWSPASPAMDIIRGHLGRQAKLDGWEELGSYCTFFAIYDDESVPSTRVCQPVKFLDNFNHASPKHSHIAFHKEFYPGPLTADKNWEGKIGIERPLWFRIMAGTHMRHVRYYHVNTAYHWRILRRHMIMAKVNGLRPFGLRSFFDLTPFSVSPDTANRIRPAGAVPQSRGIGFHVFELNTTVEKQRRLDVVMFPYLKRHGPERLKFDCILLKRKNTEDYSEPWVMWDDEDTNHDARSGTLDIDVFFVALNPVNWTEQDGEDYLHHLGLR